MKDEEMAEQFANNGYALGCTKTPFESAKDGFLAGLKVREDQLAKAKEHIQNLLELLPKEVLYHDYYKRTYVEPAEQFLSEERK